MPTFRIPSFPCRLALILVLCLAGTQAAQSQEYYLDGWTPRTFEGISDYEEKAPPSAVPTVTVTVDYADSVAIVPSTLFGNNAVSWQQASHTVHLSVHGLPAGVYVCRVRFGEHGTVIRKITVIR